jgi:hypothetical protein
LFPRGYFCKRKGDYFPVGQTAQFFDHADKRGKNCPSRNRPGGNQILPLSPFNAGSCPILILPSILAAPAPVGPLPRLSKLCRQRAPIGSRLILGCGKMGSPLFMKF